MLPHSHFLDYGEGRDEAIGDKPRSHPVTVCIATYCIGPDYPVIVGASDRMLTSDLHKSETRLSKIHQLTPNIVVLIAGDVDTQGDICVRTHFAKPKTVREAAEIYSAELAKHNRKQAERKILAPIGFTMRSFFEKQSQLSPEFVDDVMRRIRDERANVNTIICGTDNEGSFAGTNSGAHIYAVDDFGRISYKNSVGFAAIGDGAWHAQSQLMFAKYDPLWPFTRALLLTYIAKKRAEITPGVGVDTDLFCITPHGFLFVAPEVMTALEESYADIRQTQDFAMDEANKRSLKFSEAILASAQKGRASPKPPEPELTLQPQPKSRKKTP